MSIQSTAIHTPQSVWAKVIEKNRAEARKSDGRQDAFVFFVGPRGGGKSTLLNRFLYPDREDSVKPSEGLEYTYARKSREHDHEKKDLAHIWEFGGGDDLAVELAGVDNVFLGAKQVTTAVVVIVVDLSNPPEVLPQLVKWINLVRSRLKATFDRLEQRGSKLPDQLRIRAKKALYVNNEDKDAVQHTGISIMIAATKWDLFMNQDSELCKVMSRTLRCVAHTNGAHLISLGGLDGMKKRCDHDSPVRLRMKTQLDHFRRILNSLIFSGLEKKMNVKNILQKDHMQPLTVLAGMDNFREIGHPSGDAHWEELFERTFPAKRKDATKKFTIGDVYNEEDIDKMVVFMEEELQQLQQQQKAEQSTKKHANKPRHHTNDRKTRPTKT